MRVTCELLKEASKEILKQFDSFDLTDLLTWAYMVEETGENYEEFLTAREEEIKTALYEFMSSNLFEITEKNYRR